jgi:hypothetical protein
MEYGTGLLHVLVGQVALCCGKMQQMALSHRTTTNGSMDENQNTNKGFKIFSETLATLVLL